MYGSNASSQSSAVEYYNKKKNNLEAVVAISLFTQIFNDETNQSILIC